MLGISATLHCIATKRELKTRAGRQIMSPCTDASCDTTSQVHLSKENIQTDGKIWGTKGKTDFF